MVKVLACFLFLWVMTPGMTQVAIQSETDSLIGLLSKPLDDTLKARTYKKIAEQYSVSDLKNAMDYAHQGLKHVTRMQWKKGIAVFYTLLGGLHNEKGEYAKAQTYLQKAYTIHSTNQDRYNMAATLNSMGSTYQRSSRFQQAIDSYIKALQIAEQLEDNYLMSLCLDNIAIVYNNQNHFDKALTYHLKSLRFISPQDTARLATGYASIATTYVNKKDTANAHNYYENALALYKRTGDSIGIATVYTNFSVIIKDYYQRIHYKLLAQRIWNKQSPASTLSLSNIGNIAIEYLHLAQSDTLARVKASHEVPANRTALLQKAEQYLELGIALSQDANDQGNLAFLRGLRAEVAAEKGDFRKAYADMQFYHAVNDSMFSQETKNQIAETESKYELGKKNAEIAIQQLTIANQQKIRLGLLIGIGLLAVIGVLLYWQSSSRKKTNQLLLKFNTELDEANKIKARFFAIISHDLRSPIASLINFLNLQQEAPDLLSDEQATQHQKKITESAETLLETMETLLLWSKEQMATFKPRIQPTEVASLFDYVQKSFADASSVRITLSNPEHLTLLTDENYLQTIMYNLTSNAIKALKQTPDASLEWKAYQEDNHTVLSITDNGPGIQEAAVQTLTQESSAINTRSGLGLHLVRDLAKAIQCSLRIQTQPLTGTTVYLYHNSK